MHPVLITYALYILHSLDMPAVNDYNLMRADFMKRHGSGPYTTHIQTSCMSTSAFRFALALKPFLPISRQIRQSGRLSRIYAPVVPISISLHPIDESCANLFNQKSTLSAFLIPKSSSIASWPSPLSHIGTLFYSFQLFKRYDTHRGD